MTRAGRRVAALVAFAGAAVLAALAGGTMAPFSAQTSNSGSILAAGQLDAFLPGSVTSSHSTATSCLVSWTPHGSVPAG